MKSASHLRPVHQEVQEQQANRALFLCRQFIDDKDQRDREKLRGEFLLSEILTDLGEDEEILPAVEYGCCSFSVNTHSVDKLQILAELSNRRHDAGLYQEAAEGWLKVGAYSAELGDVNYFVQALLGIGRQLQIIGDHCGALKYFYKAKSLTQSMSSAVVRARLSFHLIASCISVHKLDKAQIYLDACKHDEVVSGTAEFKALTHLYQAIIQRKKGNIREALAAIRLAKELVTKGLENGVRNLIQLELGWCFIASDNAQKGIRLLGMLLVNSAGNSSFLLELNIHEALSDAYAGIDDFDKALECEQKAHQLHLLLINKISVGNLNCNCSQKLERMERLLTIQCTQQENMHLKQKVEGHFSLVERLQQDAFTDPLTQVFNRRWLDAELQNRTGIYAALLIDADYFKTVNDNFSHQVGDLALKRLASLLLQEVRKIDSVIRYGGEEFLVLLTETSVLKVSLLAERLRDCIESADWMDLLPGRPLTISIGGAVKSIDESGDMLLKRADSALYQAKEQGRNLFCFNEGPADCDILS
ncbi:GGDEF domain-containing protein [Psychromonas ossibalaenae]|uniref:GGDEF domain-containing protein n=1 Tax=Psychromonas ossibalaenae TaxID=444922 RepID=UPI00037A02CE|nr:GGDEF domain-containing protein [Psychromonas ossibalaenae]